MDIKVSIEAPGLTEAINNLAAALAAQTAIAKVQEAATPKAPRVRKGESAATVTAETPAPSPEPKVVASNEPEQQEVPAPIAEVPKEIAAKVVTLEVVREKLTLLVKAGKIGFVNGLIQTYGGSKLTDIPQDKYPEILTKAETEIAK